MSEELPEMPEPIDVRNNPESRAGEADTTTRVARASDGGAPPREAPRAGEAPEESEGGTADGNPLAGITISEEDLEESVPGDDGPTGLDGPTAGHA